MRLKGDSDIKYIFGELKKKRQKSSIDLQMVISKNGPIPWSIYYV